MITVALKRDYENNLILPLDEQLCSEVNWKIGDTIEWIDNKDGSFSLRKKQVKTELVLVESISTFRMRYVVEVPIGKKELASAIINSEDAIPLSQHHISEHVALTQVIDMEEYKHIFDEDNNLPYIFSDEQKAEFINTMPKDDVVHSKYYYDTERNR